MTRDINPQVLTPEGWFTSGHTFRPVAGYPQPVQSPGRRGLRSTSRQPNSATRLHLFQRKRAVLRGQAGHQVAQAVQPARGDGFGLGVAGGAGARGPDDCVIGAGRGSGARGRGD